MLFYDRHEAGQRLAEALAFLKGRKDVVILAIPRGGVVVGYEVAKALGAPLDVYITRKIGAPYNPEFAIGAVASDGTIVLDEGTVRALGISQDYIEAETARQREEIQRRLAEYCGERPPPELKGKTVVLVDDGVATGATILSALQALRKQEPGELILAVPVGPPDTIARLKKEADRVVCLDTPEPFWAIGRFYMIFDQTSDEEVVALLEELGGTQGNLGQLA